MPRREPSFLHVDLDAFFASVEQLLEPELRGKPVVVGGLGTRGVVSAASYEARVFGVHSAMPMGRARRLCPQAAFLPPRIGEYERHSRAVMAIFRDITPLVEPLSLDEAFLDVEGARRRIGSPEAVARLVRERVHAETGLTVSVGAATTKFLAKLASEAAKPDGLMVVEPGSELGFLHPLPVERLWGVGPATLTRLERLGIATIGDVARLPEDALIRALGRSHGAHLHLLARNVDDRDVEPGRRVKSIGHEETFPADISDRATLHREVLRLADAVAARLRAAGQTGRTVTLKVRFSDFHTITRAHTLPTATDIATVIDRECRALLDEIDTSGGVRLLGVSASGLEPRALEQPTLALDDDDTLARAQDRKHADVERAVDHVRARFGRDAVKPAVLLPAHRTDEGTSK